MGVRVNVRISKIIGTPIKVGVRTYATYANCRTLLWKKSSGKNKKSNLCQGQGGK